MLLSVALAYGYFSQNQESDIKSNRVLTWDCEFPVYKPESITITCADGGIYLDQIIWTSWTKLEAFGTAVFNENLCQPSCAVGKQVQAPVLVNLSNISKVNGKFFLRTLDIKTKDGKTLPWSEGSNFKWDLMDFAQTIDVQEK